MCLTEIMNNPPEKILHVLYDYTSKDKDELTLKRGSRLEVLSKDEQISGSEGWWIGRVVDTNSVGAFPSNFVASSQPDLRIIAEKDLSIGDVIGVGGFGRVHFGKFGDVDVAIKTPKALSSFNIINTPTTCRKSDEDDQTKTLIESLLREARLFANLKHSNIVQLYGVCPSIVNRTVYLVMEYAHGGALSELLAKRKSGLHPSVFIRYAKQIAEGMKYLHGEAEENMIHRDLKCSNVLILEPIENLHDDQELMSKTLKITDFGLAKLQVNSTSSSTAGTYPWMSPECIRDAKYSTKSDVWSFGVLLWECLTGEIPYGDINQMQVAFGIATGKYSLPIPSSCPDEFAELMQNCWQKIPEDRPNFVELCDEISGIIERNYPEDQLINSQHEEETYQSLQEDMREEIKNIFERLKNVEQEIRDREQLVLKHNNELNEQRTALEQRERQLHEREMHLIENQLRFFLTNTNHDVSHHQTPRIHKRCGGIKLWLLPMTVLSHSLLSPGSSHKLISEPTNFRHLCSINHNLGFHSPTVSIEPKTLKTSSTPNTPSTTRSRTLTSEDDPDDPPLPNVAARSTSGSELDQSVDDKSRSSSISNGGKRSRRWSKPKRTSAKSKTSPCRPGKPKWYIPTESDPSINAETASLSSSLSTPTLSSSRKNLVSVSSDDFRSSTSSIQLNVSDHSLARGLFDITSMLMKIVLGRSPPPTRTFDDFSVQNKVFSSSLSFSPPPLPKKQHKRTASSPIETVNEEAILRSRPCYSTIRPNSLVLNPIAPPPPTFRSTFDPISQSDSQLNHRQRPCALRMSSTPEDIESDEKMSTITTIPNKCHLSKSAQQLHFSSILDIETEEQQQHQTVVLRPETDRKKFSISLQELERDFLS